MIWKAQRNRWGHTPRDLWIDGMQAVEDRRQPHPVGYNCLMDLPRPYEVDLEAKLGTWCNGYWYAPVEHI